jgi:hypothetical protein
MFHSHGENMSFRAQQERRKGEPRSDRERFMEHYNLTDEQMNQILDWIGEDVYKLLPNRGEGLAQTRQSSQVSSYNEAKTKMSFYAQGGYTQEEREKLEKAIEAREKKYGYKRGSNANLTKPKEYQNIPDSQFADVVGFNYPIDKAHIHGAITYWQHMDHRKAYSDSKARAFITERIVRAALKFGIELTYDPKDPDYRNLPENLKKQMKGYGQKSMLEDWQSFRGWQEALYNTRSKRVPVI